MSMLTKIFKKVIKPLSKSIPGVGPIIQSVDAVNKVRRTVSKSIPTIRVTKMPKLPALSGSGFGGSIGSIAASALGGAAADAGISWATGGQKKKRRRGKGITSSDLRAFKRVARLVDKFSKPVHHFRNFKKGQ